MLKLNLDSLRLRWLRVAAAGALTGAAHAQHPLTPSQYSPAVAAASDEGEQAIKRFSVAVGLKAELFAAEPHLANPVAFCFDERGRVYVAETFRHSAGVGDIRGLMPWLDDELAARTIDDRLGYMKRRLGAKVADWTRESERVKLLEDRDGDGRIDHSTVFADGFNTLLEGIGSGVFARKGQVYFANIPELWLLRDTDADGVADVRRSLHRGFGVRIGFLGHDLHGLRFGPDGKLYFSIGDRGSNVETEGRHVGSPDTGEVFRCNPDGSELEVFATGLRNPQELAFDQFGNLFTGDNNSDSGDKARWVHLVEGGDSGWRVGYQFMERPYSRGPFNQEKLWWPQFEGQAAYIIPPITNITAGPSGLTYYPGTGLPEKYDDHFFLCDFHGSDSSRVHSFALRPKGASFELAQAEIFVRGLLATDVEFGVDGGVYVSDWVKGWDKNGKGRIYRFHDPAVDASPIVRETKRLLAEGMERRSTKDVAALLGHRDQRVRQEAQFELAARGGASIKTFVPAALEGSSLLARLHAIWGLGQVLAKDKPPVTRASSPSGVVCLLRLLRDADVEVRAQAAKVVGDLRVLEAFEQLARLTADASPRVQFFAAQGIGKIGGREGVAPLLALLEANADRDPYLRHAAVLALARIHEVDATLAAAKGRPAAVQMGVLLVLRRWQRPEVAEYLESENSWLVLEAARAINDQPIHGAMPELAAMLSSEARLAALAKFSPEQREALLRRVIAASLRVGTPETAQALVKFAARDGAAEAMRAEALAALSDWPRPSGRDRVIGLWRPVPSAREARVAADALPPALKNLMATAPDEVRVAALQAVERLGISAGAPEAFAALGNVAMSDPVRVAALTALAGLKSPQFPAAMQLASTDPSEALRRAAIRLEAQAPTSEAVGRLRKVFETGTLPEKQSALAALRVGAKDPERDVVEDLLRKLTAGLLAPELQLDVLEAASRSDAPEIKELVAKYQSTRPAEDPIAPFRVTLRGGNAANGHKIFLERQDAACARCHKVGEEGGEVGPELTGIGAKQPREYFLEAILLPNKQIAPGFETMLVTKKDGTLVAGVVKSDNERELTLNSPEDGLVTIQKSDIEKRERGLSAMPEGMANVLSKQDLRDLIEFLATSK